MKTASHDPRHLNSLDRRHNGRHAVRAWQRPSPLTTATDWLLAIGALLFLTIVAAAFGTAIALSVLTLI